MRTLFVLPAVTLPVALAVIWFAARQVGEAARSLQAELVRARPVADDVRACRDELQQLHARTLDTRAGAPRR